MEMLIRQIPIEPEVRLAVERLILSFPNGVRSHIQDGFVVIAGGAARRLYQGLDISVADVDIFCKDTYAELICKVMTETGWEKTNSHKGESGHVSIVVEKDGQKVNLIEELHFRSDSEFLTKANASYLFSRFDFTVCQIGFMYINQELALLANNLAILDLQSRSLQVNRIDKERGLEGTLMRLSKYIQLGYVPTEGCIKDIATAFEAQPTNVIWSS